MCKKILLVMSLVLALSLGAGGAWGAVNNFPDQTLIQVFSGPGAQLNWQDVIGPTTPTSEFQTFNATFDTSSHVLTIFSNWGDGNKQVNVGLHTIITADLFLNFNPNTNTALAAVNLFGAAGGAPTPNNVIQNPTIQTSFDIFNGSSVSGYGGNFTTNIAPATGPPSFHIPVDTTGGTVVGQVGVTWTANPVDPFPIPADQPGGPPLFSVSLDLDEVAALIPALNVNDFSFLYGTGTCGNDVIINIPVPPTLLLLGSGLLGLVGWRRFRKS